MKRQSSTHHTCSLFEWSSSVCWILIVFCTAEKKIFAPKKRHVWCRGITLQNFRFFLGSTKMVAVFNKHIVRSNFLHWYKHIFFSNIKWVYEYKTVTFEIKDDNQPTGFITVIICKSWLTMKTVSYSNCCKFQRHSYWSKKQRKLYWVIFKLAGEKKNKKLSSNLNSFENVLSLAKSAVYF